MSATAKDYLLWPPWVTQQKIEMIKAAKGK